MTTAAARVVALFGRRVVIETEDGQRREALRHRGVRDVTVGDRVWVQAHSNALTVASVAPRSSVLFRSDAHRCKTLAANVAQVAVVFAARPRYSVHFLWRALIAAGAAGVPVLAILNKVDLDSADADRILDHLRGFGARGVRIGARGDPEGAACTLAVEFAARETLLVGQSGMGKSTILNLMVGAQARTQEISTRGQGGRHTTSASHWHRFGSDGALIDTPGFQEFGLSHVLPARVASLMPDLEPYARECRFSDCRHLREPGCGILEAVQGGRIDADRYAFYAQLCAGEPS